VPPRFVRGAEWGDPVLPSPSFPADRTVLAGLIAAATSIGGKEVQQDACGHLDLPGCKVVAVADGISSSPHARLAADTAVQIVLQVVTRYWQAGYPITPGTLKQAFAEAQAAVRLQAQARGLTHAPPATTLILAVEVADRFLVAHVGDGAVVLTTGALHWMANLLYPQTGQGGAITRYLGQNRDGMEPACLELPKVWPDGGILLVGTDGALSPGQVLATAEAILREIQQQTVISLTTGRRGDPHAVLEAWVTRRLSADDNRTLGLIVSQQALDYWHNLHRRSSAQGREEGNDATKEAGGRPQTGADLSGAVGRTAG